jgi:transcriptional regulator with GAF, ATPase, and Fis domain
MRSSRKLLIAVTGAAALQALLWLLASQGQVTAGFAVAATLASAWGLIAILVVAASRHAERLSGELSERQTQHQATLDQVEQLEALNEMLVTLGRTKDAGLAFQGLARRIGRLVHCDRLGLAVMHANGRDVETFLSRVTEPERRRRPRVEKAYRLERSIFGEVIRTAEPFLVDDLSAQAGEFVDAQGLTAQGFQSVVVVPLMSRNRAIGTLMAISRQRGAFSAAHSNALQPMADVLAFAFVAQQQHSALQHYRAMETLAEVSLSVSTDINSALQAIIGQCGIIGATTPSVASDVDVIINQADRISTLLERVRTTAQERLRDAAAPIHSGAIPASPEEIASEETL